MSTPNYNKPNKNERSTESKYMQPSMRRFKRIQSGRRNPGHQTEVMQEIKAMVRFKPNKKSKKLFHGKESISVPLSQYSNVRRLRAFVARGLGEIETFAPKTIWHNAGVEV